MRTINLIWLLLVNKKFRKSLLHTLFYAMNVSHVINGNGAKEVENFRMYQCLVIKSDILDKYYYNLDLFKIPPKSLIEILTNYSDGELDEIKQFK